jgi:hypothetical protein
VVVHEAGVLPQLQQDLRTSDAVPEQEDVRRRYDDEPLEGHWDGWSSDVSAFSRWRSASASDCSCSE